MQINLNKTELTGALAALGKLVTRTSIIKTYQAVQIEGKADTLFFRTRNVVEEIEFKMTADLEDDFPAVLVSFEDFRQAVRNSKTKTLDLEVDNGEVFIGDTKLAPVNGRFPVPKAIPDQDVTISELPPDTLAALELLAPIASKEAPCSVLSGINLSRDGLTATNGKELSNIPIHLEMTGDVTIPFPLALLATKAYGQSGRLLTWQESNETHFVLTLGNWTWRAKAHRENYPNWKRIVPERTAATHHVSFTEENSERLRRYLKAVPDDPKHLNAVKLSRLPGAPDHLNLASSNGMLVSVTAEFDDNWGSLNFSVRKDYLIHLLNAGHTRIELNDAFCPVVGTGGNGQYIVMPLCPASKAPAATEQKSQEAVVQTKQTAPQTSPGSQEHQTITTTNTISNKENHTMNESPNITHTVSAPVQAYTPNPKPEAKLNPMDELTNSVDTFKAKLKDLFDEAAALSRKTREVAIAQRQKERDYLQTKRTIERIRTASGF